MTKIVAIAPQTVFIPDSKVMLEMSAWHVKAVFPPPVADHTEKRTDSNDHLIRNKEVTFTIKFKGDSVIGSGIFEVDALFINRSIEAKRCNIVLDGLSGDFTFKRLYRKCKTIKVIPESKIYPPIVVKDGDCCSNFSLSNLNYL